MYIIATCIKCGALCGILPDNKICDGCRKKILDVEISEMVESQVKAILKKHTMEKTVPPATPAPDPKPETPSPK
jgi:hypothetical protein